MIKQKDIEHIAHLARIALTEAEKEKFEKELSAILEFVEKLNEADTSSVEPMSGGTTLNTIMRQDEQIDRTLEEKSAELVKAVPEVKDGYVKVKAVFE